MVRVLALGLGLVVACSSPPTPRGPSTCTSAGRDAATYAARQATLFAALAKGRDVEWKLDTPPDVAAIRQHCQDVTEDLRILCFEAVAQSYGLAISTQPGLLADAPAQLARIDENSSAIHCRGLGAGLQAHVTTDQLAPLIANLDARCKSGIVDGFATRTYLSRLGDTKPTREVVAAIRIDDVCTGLDPRWCGFGAGRALAHLFAGDPVSAAYGCQGTQRAACLSGIAYVTTYLYEPDDLGHVAARIAAFAGDDRAGYVAGVASALQWTKRFDPGRLEHQLGCMQESDRALVEHIQAAADACHMFDFTDGVNCAGLHE